MQPKHSAIVAGLTLALSFGTVAAPVTAVAEEPTPGVASDATDIDKGLYTQQSFSGVLRSVQGVSFVNVTDEMKYFTKYESHGNYNQCFSYGDGYNALGYYQFDRRWSLIPFMRQAYNYDPAKYGMLKDAIDRAGEISNGSNPMYANGQLTELGRIAQDAFLGAYNTDPAEFSALQDAYAYNSYYAVTESWLKSALGIDISGRADCVKGMVWSITNMCGTYGCQDFFRWANLSNDMTDREFVTALSGSVVNNVATKYASQPQYHEGWKNRYRNELKDCLVYIAEDEKNEAADKNESADKKPEESEPPSTPDSSQTPEGPKPAEKPDANNNEGNGGETNGSATGTGNSNSGTTGNDSPKPSSGSSDSSAGGDSGTNTGSGSVSASGSDSSKDDSNKGTDAPVTPTNKKPSVSEVFGSTLGSLMAGPSGNSSSNKDDDGQNSVTKTDTAKDDSKNNKSEDKSEKSETDKGSGSEEKKDNYEEKDNKSDGAENNNNGADNAGDNKENTGGNKDGAGDNKDNNSGGKNDSGSGNGNAGNNGGIMPKTGDLIVMASLASASLATLGATSIVSGKHKLDQQKKAAGQNDSEE